ncbi:1,2-dihydroxy-3-keto-5-methylthiopentene dioxygenase [Malassezia vespertilionis]|uniref:Striatin N-terminal domain-containing protein n=1 Tax=Malassezia vespertilionis TaxID=2020962 RepID=A0A2N1JED9_9BASI|nr:1,2-dihydroxy-3-keto-5-methylthiopentene dioxygenase [Malassezia vespertilionis]PKI84903.1 hypothetical protein MVES_000814 [Malassezia vespertilionis]WFD05536.1 1,2-dihydroxy-3-keto-5-methylthiopentene dioxygenase [Malassezia vespertilionis]
MTPSATNGVHNGQQDVSEYSLSGVLHFLQKEWRKYEHDRNTWAIERAELRARIALLEGERRGVENVKNDLMRRIKMLEYALRQERLKSLSDASHTSGKQAERIAANESHTPQYEEAGTTFGAQRLATPELFRANACTKNASMTQSNVKLPLGVKDSKGRAKSRAYLQQCLQEIAYLTSATTLNPLSNDAESVDTGSEQSSLPRPHMSLLEEDASNHVEHLEGREEKRATESAATHLLPEKKREAESAATPPALEYFTPTQSEPNPLSTDLVKNLTDMSALEKEKEKHDAVKSGDAALAPSPVPVADVQLWNLKGTMRAHFDVIRALTFEGDRNGFFTGSDDCTIKQWALSSIDPAQSQPVPQNLKTQHVFTFRGHTAAVTSLAYSKEQQCLYSSSMDFTIRAWPVATAEDRAGAAQSTLIAKTPEIVWNIVLLQHHGKEDALLASTCADGLVRLWRVDTEEPQLYLSWDYFGTDRSVCVDEGSAQYNNSELPVPTFITAVPADLRICAVSYTNGCVKTFSVETGNQLKCLTSPEKLEKRSDIHTNMLGAHPTLPLVLTAQENNYIRMLNVTTGECIMELCAHNDSVSCIDVDPSGLTLMSGSHDCTLRFWDMISTAAQNEAESGNKNSAANPGQPSDPYSAVCFQEVKPHSAKDNEGILVALYHPTAPYVATAGADGMVQLFG